MLINAVVRTERMWWGVVALLLMGMSGPCGEPPPDAGRADPGSGAVMDFVFIISVDGLRSDAIPAGGSSQLPNLHRLLRGSSTLNARTDPDFTITLPNHTSMITGRPTNGRDGHGWSGNVDPPPDVTLHSNRGFEVVSAFDVAHQHGIRTGAFFGKTKFSLWITSYNAGREPLEMAITRAAMCESTTQVTDEAIDLLHAADRALIFMHYAAPDTAGHAGGWDLTPGSEYMLAVGKVDAELGRLMNMINADEDRRGRCAIILTADHGGGFPHTSHVAVHMWVNYIIPFLVWVGDDVPGGDLYEINAEVRRDPSLDHPVIVEQSDASGVPDPPVRNGDAANLAMHLLGLPPVPGSTINVGQELRVHRPEK